MLALCAALVVLTADFWVRWECYKVPPAHPRSKYFLSAQPGFASPVGRWLSSHRRGGVAQAELSLGEW